MNYFKLLPSGTMFVDDLGAKLVVKLAVIISALLLLPCSSAYADFVCSSDISFKWKKEITKEKEKEIKEYTTFSSRVERRGADEAAAKKALELALAREKSQTLAACKREHEDVAGCMSAKFSALATTIQTASFHARKQLEEAIASGCKDAQGTCSEVGTSEPRCEEIKKPESADAAKGDGAKKDDKGKGKKK